MVNLSGLEVGEYTVATVSVPEGYTAPDPDTVEVAGGKTTTLMLAVEQGASTEETTTDEATTETAANNSSSDKNTNQTKTGDSADIYLIFSIMICAIVGATVLIVNKKKRGEA